MLKGSKCMVGNKTNKHAENFISYEGMVVSDPQLDQVNLDWWVLVMVDGRLNRVDTDYIFILGE